MKFIAPAIKFKQGDWTIYSTVLPAGDLADHTTVRIYNPNTRKGYQRAPESSHINKIRKYVLRKDALMPLPGVLSVPEKRRMEFKPLDKKNPSVGILRIPDGVNVYVVDMQHRREGFSEAFKQKPRLRSYMMPVVIIENLSESEEALQFYIMNRKSKRLKSDLALRVILEHFSDRDVREVTGEKSWRIKAVQVTIALNKYSSANNPWCERIQAPNEKKGINHLVTERTFVRSLRNLVDADTCKLAKKKPNDLAKYVASFWYAISRLYPDAFANPKAYRIQRFATSVVGFHNVMPLLLEEGLLKKKIKGLDDLEEFLVKRLQPLKKLPSSYWLANNDKGVISYGTGFGAEGRFTELLLKTIRIGY